MGRKIWGISGEPGVWSGARQQLDGNQPDSAD